MSSLEMKRSHQAGWLCAAGGGAAALGVASARGPQLVIGALVAAALATVAWRARHKLKRPATEAVAWSGRWAPELVLLPLAVSVRQSVALTGAVLALVVVVAVVRPRHDGPARIAPSVPFVLLCASAVVTWRPGDSTPLAFIAAVAFVLVVSLYKGTATVDALHSLTRGVSLYLLANVAGWAAGLPSPVASGRTGGLDSSSGLLAERALFPFERSINETPIVAAGFLCVISGYVVTRKAVAYLEWLAVFAALFVFLGSNARTPLAVGVLLVVTVMVAPRLTRWAASPVAVVSLALPFYLAAITPILSSLSDALARNSFLARGESGDKLGDLNGRGTIWHYCVDFIDSDSDGGLVRWLGWGEPGHVNSGVYKEYFAALNSNFLTDPTSLSTHNSLLQQLLEGGVVGALLLLTGLVWTIYRLRSLATIPWMIGLTAIAVGGATEAVGAPARTALPFFLVLAVATFMTSGAARGLD